MLSSLLVSWMKASICCHQAVCMAEGIRSPAPTRKVERAGQLLGGGLGDRVGIDADVDVLVDGGEAAALDPDLLGVGVAMYFTKLCTALSFLARRPHQRRR